MPSIFDHSVELRHLRYFCAVADAGSLTRAAAAIGLRQPTITHQIQQLERALGSRLLQRSRTCCRLTAAGELLLPYARRVLGEMDNLRNALDDLSDLQRGSLTLAMLPMAAEGALPVALARFHKAHPNIQVKALTMSVDEMARSLSIGAIDMGIGSQESASTVTTRMPLFKESLLAIFPGRLRAPLEQPIPLSDLEHQPLVVPPPGYGTRTLLLHAWAKIRRQPRIALEVDSTEAVLQAVESGGGVGIVPASALWRSRPGDWHAAKLCRPSLQRDIVLYHSRIGDERPSAQAFVTFIRQAIESLAESAPFGRESVCLN